MNMNIEDIYPLSPMQQGMLFHTILDPESGEYFEQTALTLEGAIDIDAFHKSWLEVIRRHPIFRTIFVWEDLEEPLQVVQQSVNFEIEQVDLRHYSAQEQEDHIIQFRESKRRAGISLSEAPLMNLSLLCLSANSYKLIWNFHHILIDGWCMPLILKEVFTFYEGYRQGLTIPLPKSRPYRDYIAYLQERDQSRAEPFWREMLRGFTAPTNFSMDKLNVETDPALAKYRKDTFNLPADLTASLQEIARNSQLTLNTIIQGAWSFILHKYSGEDDVIFGATVSGRPTDLPGAEQMIGLFINTLPVRTTFKPQYPMIEWLKDLQKQQVAMREFEYTPLVDVQKWSQVPHNMFLFNSILVFENYPVEDTVKEQKGSLSMHSFDFFSRTNFPLTLAASPGKEITLIFAYETQRFNPQMIANMFSHIRQILSAFAANPDIHLTNIMLLDQEKSKQLLQEWNNSARAYDHNLCIHEWFERNAAEFPNRPAVFFENQHLTYRELNERANQMAAYLIKNGVGSESLVAIMLERSLEMVVASLAVLKAGGAYAPMDTDYPPDRLNYMLSDSGAKFLITKENILSAIELNDVHTILLDKELQTIERLSKNNPLADVTADHLAYVIYTSGSTGRPKGVMMRHRGIINLIKTMIDDYGMTPDSRVLQFASFSFDASVCEIFLGLLPGCQLYLATKDTVLSAQALGDYMRENRITTITFPPSLLSTISDQEFPDLKTVVSVGEACSWDLAERWKAKTTFFNGYGPTEITVGACWGVVNERMSGVQTAPIGKPIANDQIYILDKWFNPLPVGVPGEICIAGPGIARGYLNRPDLTAEKFIPNPFIDDLRLMIDDLTAPNSVHQSSILNQQSTINNRLYRTGDLGRWLPNGTIEFLGRIDFQVKVRGFRIELGEIEATLNNQPLVKEAVVIVREDSPGDKRLVAYCVLHSQIEFNIAGLRQNLKEVLPDFMIPSAFVRMAAFPLTSNGKIDRKALSAPEWADVSLQETYVAPRTLEEELLAGIWADILKLEKVGINSSFFDLGGHSLLATQVISRVRDAFKVDLPLRTLFIAPTIRQLVIEIENIRQAETGFAPPPLAPVSRDQALPLSFAQQRLWFLDLLEPGSASYNIPSALRLKGELRIDVLEKSLTEIIRRHEILRTTFRNENGKPVQVITAALPYKINIEDFSNLPETEREQAALEEVRIDASAPFDLANGPLFRAALFQIAEQDFILLFNMHHIISDGWSIGVLAGEFIALYNAYDQAQESPLTELPVQYADFAHWQRSWLAGEELHRQIDFWRNELAGSPPLLELPTDRPRPAVQTFNGAVEHFQIDAGPAASVRQISQKEGVTPFMILLASFQTLMHRWSRQDDVLVGSPIANRTHSELESLIGFFVNTLIFRANFEDRPNFRELLRQVRERALSAYAHQDLPFEKLVEELKPVRDLSHAPLFQVAFILQNLPPQKDIALPGLTLSSVDANNPTAKYDLTLTMTESPSGYYGTMEYNTDLFDAATIQRMLRHYLNLLEAALDDPDLALRSIDFMDDVEKKKLLFDWNQTAAGFPVDSCVQQWFEEIVAAQPDAPAICFQSDGRSSMIELSYQEFNQRANRLAHYLKKSGVGAEKIVGICLERSVEMAVSMMAILKAGGAYVPIDPAYPAERIQYMIEDSGLSVLLTQKALVPVLPAHHAQTVCVDRDWPQIDLERSENLPIETDPENIAYLIYTSGSTGKPKGTMLRHRGACNLATAQIKAFKVKSGSRIMQFSSLSFDAATWEFIMAMLSGAALALTSRETVSNGAELVQVMKQQRISTITIPPSVLAVLPHEPLPDLQTLITAGEAVSGELVDLWGQGRTFFNAYGPTETTVCASMHPCQGSYPQGPPIGRPINNFQIYIMDSNLKLTPIGVPGELCVGGLGLARGYLNRPDLTAEKFIPNPFIDDWRLTIDDLSVSDSIQSTINNQQSTINNRLYRTGDLCRYLPNGDIEYLGRIDQQVKIRGFRIELGEIEAALDQHEQIKDAVVIAREDRPGDKRLAAYIVPTDSVTLNGADVKSFLRERLPDYMVPSAIVVLEALPLTPNGKIDRRALPPPEISRDDLSSAYIAPRNDAEEKLVAIVAELLNIEKVGINDNFFELGGHSLLATQFISRLRDAFEVELPLRTLFEKPTAEGLIREIEKVRSSGQAVEAQPQISRVSRAGRAMKRTDLE